MTTLMMACGNQKNSISNNDDFNYSVDKFADIEIMRYQVPDFDKLSLKQKELIYYLNQAALEGRDILYDQNNKYNLVVRRTLEGVYENYKGDRNSKDFIHLTTYLKRIWMGNGIHHHYSEDKFIPEFSSAYFTEVVKSIDPKTLPLSKAKNEMILRQSFTIRSNPLTSI